MDRSSFSFPKDWVWKSLGDVVENHDGKRKPVKSNDREGFKGIYPYYGASGVIDYVNEYLFDGEYLLISEDGANLVMRKTPIAFISTGKFWVNNHAHVVKAKAHLTTNKFLECYLASADISSFITGSAQPKLSQAKMNEIQIPLPPPTEQRRIVAKIDAAFTRLDEAIRLQKQNLARTEELKKSVLEEVFGKGEWNRVKIEKIAYIKGGKRLPKGKSLMTEKTKYPYIRVADFTESGTIDADKVMYLDEDTQKSIKNYIIRSHDLYISIAGTIGRTGIIPKEFEGANLTENAARLVYKHPDSISNKFVYYFTISRFFTDQAIDATKTVAQPKLALTRLAQIEIPLPTTLSEQLQIVAHLDRAFTQIDTLQTEQTTRLQHLESLKSSILAEAFQGKL